MIRIGILGPSEIAYRRFMPALKKMQDCQYMGVAVADVQERNIVSANGSAKENAASGLEKAAGFQAEYGGKVYSGYMNMINDPEIDALYLPLPPSLHFYWAKKALEAGKHILVEKPCTINYEETEILVNLAREKGLAIHENYMFVYHSQMDAIKKMISDGMIGDVRLYRGAFGFPRREQKDFRYNKSLGGGALFDCGGYPLKLARYLLGTKCSVKYAELQYSDDFEVDIAGSAICGNGNGTTVQVAFGMDNEYKCELEVWGSKGRLYTNRIFTAPEGYCPIVEIQTQGKSEQIVLEADDAFLKSIQVFEDLVKGVAKREDEYLEILEQAKSVASVVEYARREK